MQLAVGFRGTVPAPTVDHSGVHGLVLRHLLRELDLEVLGLESIEHGRAHGLHVYELEAFFALAVVG